MTTAQQQRQRHQFTVITRYTQDEQSTCLCCNWTYNIRARSPPLTDWPKSYTNSVTRHRCHWNQCAAHCHHHKDSQMLLPSLVPECKCLGCDGWGGWGKHLATAASNDNATASKTNKLCQIADAHYTTTELHFPTLLSASWKWTVKVTFTNSNRQFNVKIFELWLISTLISSLSNWFKYLILLM